MGPSLSQQDVDVAPPAVPAAIDDEKPVSTPTPCESDVVTGQPTGTGPVPVSQPDVWGMSAGDRRVVFAFAVVAMLLMAVHWVRIVGWRPTALTVDRPDGEEYRFVLDVNSATWVEWMQLDGIGETLARRIVANREEHGPFLTSDDVGRVPGVGAKTLAKVQAHLICEPVSDSP